MSIVANHPQAGGSHLPDITVITPVFENGKIVFFTASRGHHADIGGILAGCKLFWSILTIIDLVQAMPPTSKTLFEEGAQIKSFKLVNKGEFQHDELVKYMVEEPAKSASSVPRVLVLLVLQIRRVFWYSMHVGCGIGFASTDRCES